MISLKLRKKLELWSVITALILMAIVFLLFVFVYVTTARMEGKSEIQTGTVKYEPFGIITHEDIYLGEELDMSKYTSHGRLKKAEE